MADRPILFSSPMVRALLAGTKTKTRRVVNEPGWATPGTLHLFNGQPWASDPYKGDRDLPCPYGQPGDTLYVKETFFAFGRWETRYSAKKGRDEWHFVDMTLESGRQYHYKATAAPVGCYPRLHRNSDAPAWWKRPAIFMPRRASRILLEVTDVRVERLQDISDEDAIAEGIEATEYATASLALRAHPLSVAQLAFSYLWEAINGTGSWDQNPWVWAVSFRRIKP